MTLPALFPVDKELCEAAHNMDTGADTVERDKLVTAYRHAVLVFNTLAFTDDDMRNKAWQTCVNFERRLRGLVAEAAIGRRRGLPYFQFDSVEW
jgi:hypothetical protein